MNDVYHYTSGRTLLDILRSGRIEPAPVSISESEIPAVWFTTSPVWDEMASKAWRDEQSGRIEFASRERTEQSGGGLVRIRVDGDAASFTWQQFRALGGISNDEADAIEAHARSVGSDPELWYASFSPVELGAWRDVEQWTEGGWRSMLDQIRRPIIGALNTGRDVGRVEVALPLAEEELQYIERNGLGDERAAAIFADLFERDAPPRGLVFGIIEDVAAGECSAGFGRERRLEGERIVLVASYDGSLGEPE